MELRQAINEIKKAITGMRLQSRKSVFDEWLIVAKNVQGFDVLHHKRPLFQRKSEGLDLDIHMLADEIKKSTYTTGQYFFSMEAPGSFYDAFLVAGPNKYIIFNNTVQSMTDIATDPLWVDCQFRFVELSELFQQDCLE
jgi:hypothetical protein